MKKSKNTGETPKKLKITPQRPSELAGKLKKCAFALLTLLTAFSDISCSCDRDEKPAITKKGEIYYEACKNLKTLRKNAMEKYQDAINAQNDYIQAITDYNQGVQDSINAAADVKTEGINM